MCLMFCSNANRLLTRAASHYSHLGYKIGVTRSKVLIDEDFSPDIDPAEWDSISIILNGLVCVDLDSFQSLPNNCTLPPTLKERSPRGMHFFYRLPVGFTGVSKIGWKKNIDLLTKTSGRLLRYKTDGQWLGHVLCSPSKGYTRLYPRDIPRKNDLPMAPDWVIYNIQ